MSNYIQVSGKSIGNYIKVYPSIDLDAQAFLNASGITDSVITSAIDTLVKDLKTANIWSKMKAIYPMVGGTAGTHKWNLKDPRDLDIAFRLSFYGGWVHSSNGALPNGINAYANTNLNANILTTYSNHISYYSRTNNALNIDFEIGVGTYTGQNSHSLFIRRSDNTSGYDTGNNSVVNRISFINTVDSLGFFLGSINSQSMRKYYKNAVLQASNLSSLTEVLPNGNFYLACYNIISSMLPNYFGSKQCAFASIGYGLSDTESSNFYLSVQAFQTTLNRQV